QLELSRLHDRQIRRLRPLEDAAGINAHLTPGIPDACTVAHQPAHFGIEAVLMYCGERMVCRQLSQLHTPVAKEGIIGDKDGGGSFVRERLECGIDLADGAGVENLNL